MLVTLRYGRDGLNVALPDSPNVSLLRMPVTPSIADSAAALADALANPIASRPLGLMATGRSSACITVSDITRPVPNALIVPQLLNVLNDAGVPDEYVTIVIGTGLHRPNTESEILEMLGSEAAGRCSVVNHLARDDSTLVCLGETRRGTPVWINRTFAESDLRIATSLIEPHLMAGFSGGRKAICPGMAGVETMRVMHGPAMLGHETACEGRLGGNPFHEEATRIARLVGVDFSVNVSLNDERQVTGIFAGDLEEAHDAGCAFVADATTAYIDTPADVVVTTSAGYPLDLTFYQSIKAMTAALPIVKPGGTMIVAAACEEGVGSPDFQAVMRDAGTPDDFMRKIVESDYFVPDQWQLQEMCKALDVADVLYSTDAIPPDALADLFVTPVASVEDGLAQAMKRHGPDARIAVIPEGPYVMPRVRG